VKRLLVCRHAKSSWKDGTLADFDRPLNKRGRGNAPEMAGWLRAGGVIPDLVVSSTAVRALDTAKLMAREFKIQRKKILALGELYDSYPAKIMQIVQGFDDRYGTVLLLGHNPELTILVNILGNLRIENIPTCGVVGLDFAVNSWSEIREGGASLAFFEYPRKEQ
jgi:phosphohistidine phosphatase